MMQRPAGRAALPVVVGLVVGALTPIGQTYLDGALNAFVNLASAWPVAPFAVGATMRTRGSAAVAGLVVCLCRQALALGPASRRRRGCARSCADCHAWL